MYKIRNRLNTIPTYNKCATVAAVSHHALAKIKNQPSKYVCTYLYLRTYRILYANRTRVTTYHFILCKEEVLPSWIARLQPELHLYQGLLGMMDKSPLERQQTAPLPIQKRQLMARQINPQIIMLPTMKLPSEVEATMTALVGSMTSYLPSSLSTMRMTRR